MEQSRIEEIEALTGLGFCDEDCYCGQNDQVFKTIVGNATPDWLPDFNWAEPEILEKWLIDNGYLDA